jgi:hypothetical protein
MIAGTLCQTQESAERCARSLIHSWVEYGPKQCNEYPPDDMPSGNLKAVANQVLIAMVADCCRDLDEVMPYFTSAPDPVRLEFLEAMQEPSFPRPDHCGPLIEKLNAHKRAFKTEDLACQLRSALDRGEDTAEIISQLNELASDSDTGSPAKLFEFFHADELTGTSEAMDFVEGVLTEGGASVIYGPSNCGKSFWIVDLGVAVATGAPFRDELEVEQGAVVYVALEGAHGAKNRIAALRQSGRLTAGAPFFLIFDPVSLLESGHADRLAQTIASVSDKAGLKVKLVILDTMARAMAGGDENSGVDMTAAVKSIDAIRAATGAHVSIVHHCGKDEARGARGHSSLRAAVDTEIEITRPSGETISTVRVTKQRDLQAGEAMPFSLEVVALGTNRRGKPITSCIVRHEDEMMASKPSKAGRKAICTAEELLQFLPAKNITDWQERVADEIGLGRSQFYDMKKQLKASGKFRTETATNRIIAA